MRFDNLDRHLLRALAEDPSLLNTLEWRTFEYILAGILESMGYEVELRQGTKDGGIDVVAIKKSTPLGEHKYLIQAKRWSRKVGVAAVRELLYLKGAHGATKACLATTSSFTQGALRLGREHRWELELRDFERLREWLATAVPI